MTEQFPTGWSHAVIVVAHPDDPEYGIAHAVSRWTREGRRVSYLLLTSGEAGIQGMEPAECGPLREEEQRRAGVHVGVTDIEFLGLPDSRLSDVDDLAGKVAEALARYADADLIVCSYRGPEYAPGIPNQPDHIVTGEATVAAVAGRDLWVFEAGPDGTHHVDVDEQDVAAAVASLAEHRVYLEVLDPDTPVIEQARAQVDRVTDRSAGSPRISLGLVHAAGK